MLNAEQIAALIASGLKQNYASFERHDRETREPAKPDPAPERTGAASNCQERKPMPRPKKTDGPVKSEAQIAKERRERFLEAAPRRVDRVVTTIRALGKCSSKNYSYDMAEVNQILSTLDNELSDLRDSFTSKKAKTKTSFTFGK
jgi:hypothetical protein